MNAAAESQRGRLDADRSLVGFPTTTVSYGGLVRRGRWRIVVYPPASLIEIRVSLSH